LSIGLLKSFAHWGCHIFLSSFYDHKEDEVNKSIQALIPTHISIEPSKQCDQILLVYQENITIPMMHEAQVESSIGILDIVDSFLRSYDMKIPFKSIGRLYFQFSKTFVNGESSIQCDLVNGLTIRFFVISEDSMIEMKRKPQCDREDDDDDYTSCCESIYTYTKDNILVPTHRQEKLVECVQDDETLTSQPDEVFIKRDGFLMEGLGDCYYRDYEAENDHLFFTNHHSNAKKIDQDDQLLPSHTNYDSDDDGIKDLKVYDKHVHDLKQLTMNRTSNFLVRFENKSWNKKHNLQYSILIPPEKLFNEFTSLIKQKTSMSSSTWCNKMWRKRRQMKRKFMIFDKDMPDVNVKMIHVPLMPNSNKNKKIT
jgi:hypothetical protein